MGPEDFLVRRLSIDLNAPILPKAIEYTVQAVTTETPIPRSSSLEVLAQYTQTEVPVLARPVFTKPQLKQLEKAMGESFQVTFHHCREMVKHTTAIKIADHLHQSLCEKIPIFKKISDQNYNQLLNCLFRYSFPVPFKEIDSLRGRLTEETIANTVEFYSEESFLALYDTYLKGGDLYKETTKKLVLELGSMIFIRRISPVFLAYHFSNLSAEIFDFVFEAYQSKPLLYRIKNAMILYYICLEVYGKLMQDILAYYKSFLFSQPLRLRMDAETMQFLLKGSQNMKNLVPFLDAQQEKSKDPEAELKNFSADFDRYFTAYKQNVRDIETHALNLDYIAFYLSKHATAQMALENHEVFPQDILGEFVQSKSINTDSIARLVTLDEVYVAESLSMMSGEVYYSRSNFFLAWDQCHFSAQTRLLERKLKTVKVKQLKDVFSLEIYQAIQPLLLKLKTMDLASPAYKIDDINAIYQDLKLLLGLIENLQGISALAKTGLIPSLKAPAKKTPQKKKGKKKKASVIAPVVPEAPVRVPVVAPKKAVPSKNPEVRKISEIAQRITENLERENQYYQAAKNYILSLMTNAHAKGLVEELFNPKANLKNILSQKDMTLIVDQMSSKIDAITENLKGSNGFRFRVEDKIYTCHASTAEVGHIGHGGAIKGFRDFLITVYGLSLRAADQT